MSKHTLGPWTVEYDNADERSGGQWFNAGPAKVWFSYSSNAEECAEAAANARLIAAAPELLEALKDMLDYAPEPPAFSTACVYERARAAIAKAEGA